MKYYKQKELGVEFFKKNKKHFMLAGLVVGGAAVLYTGFNFVTGLFQKDAVISGKPNFEFRFSGYDGYGQAHVYATNRYSSFTVKDAKTKEIKEKIEKAITDAEVSLDKQENLKNGDKVVVTLNFKKPEGLKIKEENLTLKEEITVSGLEKAIVTSQDIPEKSAERIVPKVESSLKEYVDKNIASDIFDKTEVKNVTISKIAALEKPAKFENGRLSDRYKQCYVYKGEAEVTKDNKTEKHSKYYAVVVRDFELEGDFVEFEVSSYPFKQKNTSDISEEEFISILTADGFVKLP